MESRTSRVGSLLGSLAVCGTIVSVCLFVDYRFHHWFVIPVLVCGTLIGIDAVAWARGKMDLFDPVGVLGVIAWYFFFAAPLLYVPLGSTMGYVVPPDDWQEWLGRMAILNIGGIIVYLLARDFITLRRRPPRLRWTVDESVWKPVLLTLMVFSAVLQAVVYAQYGGVVGYMANVFEENGGFQGMGWIFMLSESFPILAAMAYVLWCRRSGRIPGWIELTLVLLAFTVLQLLFGGLRGSRSNTVWALFWAVGLVHLVIRPVPRVLIALGLGMLCGFMYAYGFYKSHGLEAWRAFTSASARAEMQEEGHRTLQTVLLADFARSDVQAFLLYRFSAPSTVADHQLAFGRTYLQSATLLIPDRLLWFDPPGKTVFGTEVEFGRGTYHIGEWESSRVYGLAGEAMLNFGVWSVPFSYVLLGLAVGVVKNCFDTWQRSDPRTLLLPLLINLCFVILVGDSDNVVFFVVKGGAMAFLAILLISRMWSANAARVPEDWGIPEALPAQGPTNWRWGDVLPGIARN